MRSPLIRDPFHQLRTGIEHFLSRGPDNGLLSFSSMPVDVSRRDDAVMVRASVPGVKKDDIDISVRDGMLSITARRSEDEATRGEHYFRRERRLGIMSRHIALPEAVSGSDIDAELKAGVLTVTLSIPEGRQSPHIHVRDADETAAPVEEQSDGHPDGYSEI